MAFADLLPDTVTVVTPGTETSDAEGNTVEGAPSEKDYAGWLQQTESVEVRTSRTVVTTRWLLFAEVDAPLSEFSRVVINGRMFEVVGEPDLLRTPRGSHHWEARLQVVSS